MIPATRAAGDCGSLRDYAGWIRSIDPGRFDRAAIDMFEPLWTDPEHPDILVAAAALFEDPKLRGTPRRVFSGNASRHDGAFRPGRSAMPLRVADVARQHLQRLDGMPWFQSDLG